MRLTAAELNSAVEQLAMEFILAALLVLLVLLQLRLWQGEGSLSDIQRLEGEIAAQTAINARLAERNEGLKQEVGDLKNGLDSIEERARSEMGLIKQGETYFLVVDKEATAPAAVVEPAPSP